MADIIDISLPLHSGMPVWPGSAGLQLSRTLRLEDGDSANVSRLDCDVHAGTHVDAPLHVLSQGVSVEQLPLDVLIGPAVVASLPEVEAITAEALIGLALPTDTSRLLLHTRNSQLWATGVDQFRKDYVALTADAAQWVVDNGIRLIGVDYLSVQRFEDSPLTHQILLQAGVIIVEGLNLTNVRPRLYELTCLPICLVGCEGAPARAVLRPIAASQETG